MNTIYTSPCNNFRIIEVIDLDSTVDDLAGDSFNPKVCFDIDPLVLAKKLVDFTKEVENEGVFGYELQKWNPKPNRGWEHLDSCYGFIGSYNPKVEIYSHYIIDEMIETVRKELS
jgi:hypothetical protein